MAAMDPNNTTPAQIVKASFISDLDEIAVRQE
jgi:hypothetical protein